MTTDRLLGPVGQGRLIGRRYRLLSPVGRGGMGMVWHAHDVLLDRDVAVKELMLPFGLDDAGMQAAHRRMLREARSAARLSHPGIVTVHDVVEEDGRPWIVMELVRAWSLEQAVRQSGPLPVVQAAEIGVRVLDALRHAHAAGILHRDVKPGNVLLTSDRVVLTDFGIAAIEGDVSITQTGLLMGSPAYIPPERLRGRPVTHAADLWSFGATLYAAVEGRPPYEGPDAVAVLGAVLTQEPNRPQRAGALLPVIDGLLRKNPADRLPAAQVAEMLEGVLHSHGAAVSGRPGSPTSVPTPQDSTPAGLLPPLDLPSGPLPSRIIETPSGPVRVPMHPDDAQTPGTQTPGTQTPGAQTPGAQTPGAHSPGTHSPGTHAQGAQTPGTRSSDAQAPGTPPQGPAPLAAPTPATPAWEAPVWDAFASASSAPPGGLSDLASLGGFGDLGSPGGGSGTPGSLAEPPAETPARRSTPGVGRRRKETSEPPRKQASRSSMVLVAVAAIAVIAVVVTLLLTLLPDDAGDRAAEGRAAVSAAATSPGARQPSAAQAPKGYRTHTEAGISLAVPKDWTASVKGETVTFSGPADSGQSITVRKIADGGQAALVAAEQNLKVDDHPDYTQIRLGETSYRWPAAEWEYTYTNSSEVTVHRVTRYVTAEGQAYSITFTAPDFDWTESAAPVRKALWDTFTPA
ncbi:protein kinase domain-containing protein [Sphaerimonospora sp. CA-214678]|uniref:serine/threonine-protein kinase n=1 Tax=Sphaerimonospora sp. CA-214678 TaxID=3240029 RepID=UPI003D8D88B0